MSAVRSSEQPTVDPVVLQIEPGAGHLPGSNERYEKFWRDLAGVYRSADAYRARLAADDGRPVYWVESSRTEAGPGGLITGLSVLEPGTVGEEYAMTRGHLHAIGDRAELYVGVSGTGVMILETLDGRSEVIDIAPGRAVYVPGHWIHRSVNVGTEQFCTLFCYPADAGQDYAIIERAGGMQALVVRDGEGYRVRANPDHHGYQRVAGR